MGYLWANMEKIDVQASEAALTAAKYRAQAAEAELLDTKAELSDTKVELSDTKVKLSGAETEIERLKAMLTAHGVEMPES